ncbi:MAG: hypothetical protein JWN84_510 [Nocardioides sp.]|nr:hypothetical protein [Nocardioides sp.]
MSRRPHAAVLAATLVAGLLVGCGGPDEPDDAAGATTPAPSSSSTDSPTDASTTSESPSEGADPSAYLPVPAGVELTPPGTSLPLKKGAFVAWNPRQDLVGVVGLEVRRVEQTTVKKSLRGFQLDEQAKASTPYFVTSEVGNGGDTDLGGRQLPLYVVDTEGRLVPPTGVDQGFDPCPGSVLPAIFAPGDTATSCLIFLVPEGAELASVMFRPPEGVVPITWTGTVKDLGEPTTRNSGGKGGRGGTSTGRGRTGGKGGTRGG